MKIMLIAHGAHYSTYDIYNYYNRALRNTDHKILSFPYHNVLDYHNIALSELNKNISKDDLNIKTIYAASRDIITETILFEPDFILCIGGLVIPPKTAEIIYNLRNVLLPEYRYKIGYIFTESPYQDIDQERYMQMSDFCFLNDLYSVNNYNANRNLYIDYLPHAYDESVHYSSLKEKTIDVMFCGTLYPNRMEIFSGVNWDAINIKLYGTLGIYDNIEKFGNILQYVTDRTVDNISLAEYYRQSKLSINVHRNGRDLSDNDSITGYSMNPRIRESVMCGCLPITDYRKEIEDVFGDSVPFFDGSSLDLENKIKFFLSNEDEVRNRVEIAKSKCKDHTYKSRAEKIILPMLAEVEQIYGKDSWT